MACVECDTPFHKDKAARTSRGQRDLDRVLKFRSDHRMGSEAPLAEINLHEGETLESALRRFKRQVLQEDIIKETKRHSYYLKPGQKKRLKSELARKRERKRRTRERTPETR